MAVFRRHIKNIARYSEDEHMNELRKAELFWVGGIYPQKELETTIDFDEIEVDMEEVVEETDMDDDDDECDCCIDYSYDDCECSCHED